MIDFKLNFLGVTVTDFEKSFKFYSELLGIETKYSRENWVAFKTTGMKFELFSRDLTSPPKTIEEEQNIRPSISVTDLRKTVSELQRDGVSFNGAIEKTAYGERIELLAPEGILWILSSGPDVVGSESLRNPHLGLVEIKTHDLPRQQVFYTLLTASRLSRDQSRRSYGYINLTYEDYIPTS